MSAPTITFKNTVICNLLFVIFRQRIPFFKRFCSWFKKLLFGPKMTLNAIIIAARATENAALN